MLHHFYPTGRLSRWPYFWRIIALYFLAFVCYGLPALAEYQFNNLAAHWQNIALAGMTLCFYLGAVQVIKRLHDLNLRGWWIVLSFVPIVSLGLGNALMFVSGTAGPNRFGPAPGHPAAEPLALA